MSLPPCSEDGTASPQDCAWRDQEIRLREAAYILRHVEDVPVLRAAGLAAAHGGMPTEIDELLTNAETVVVVDPVDEAAAAYSAQRQPAAEVLTVGLPPVYRSIAAMVGVPASEIGRRPNWDAASAETARSTWIGWCAEHAILRAPGMQLKPMGMSFSDVFDEFERWGPLIHEPTGIATLDDMTGGGIVYGSSVALLGIPDAGKTMFAIQIAHEYAQRGIVVGFLGVDEEPGDLVLEPAKPSLLES